ncbi:MAG TPA: ABC transporter permease [Nocardioides sp.]|uniref:sugar ABC transporter permease n=1 Tax=uncultured Nocardioides sp. TaxID=198441 RepID=UPI000ECFD15E|nr:ABC transporter permease [uncultured Nocardioides sp.]HCB07639.1 ABC transporter permease [Nocardioides sp.]HRD60281.1 ABC transporter permease [Nocardioides sp.]HRI94409.1 ABC transporter permease [Nocardioides sp.]HRK46617.1 ABC transporter permease [Nocardioides sp.]
MTVGPDNTSSTSGTTGSSGSTALADADFAADSRSSGTLGDAARDYINRVRSGDMGSLPAVLGLLVLVVIFSIASDTFTTKLNIANLITQAAPISVLAMGLVIVLLLGEIDLSAGVAGSTGAAVTALLIVDHGQGWPVAVLAGLLAGAVIGLAIGLLVARLGIPSFVVTLAFFLGLQGVMLKMIGEGGSVRFANEFLRGLAIKNLSPTAGWVLAVVVVAAYTLLTVRRYRVQVNRGLQRPPLGLVVFRIVALAVVLIGLVAFMNVDRSRNPNFPIEGVPRMLVVVMALLVFWTFILNRTRYGRYLYAVGGNAEAARRAGINVLRIRVSAFVICSTMAVISGLLLAANTGKVSPGSGAGNTLLYAVAAAVIGGTSLFGGKGRAIDAVIGGVVIATVSNGLLLLNNAAYINFIVTGAVLLLAASVDAISRRRRSAAGV